MIGMDQGLFTMVQSEDFLSWIILTTMVLFVTLFLLFVGVRIFYNLKIEKSINIDKVNEMARKFVLGPYEMMQAFFEVLISNACIIVTIYIFYWATSVSVFLESYSNYLLLILIVLSVIANNIIDKKIGQEMLSIEDKASIRLMSSLSIVLIFGFIKIKFSSSDYDELILCYVGLVLGRFVYFDSTWNQFKVSILSFFRHVIPFSVAMFFTYIVSYFGFHYGIITQTNILASLVWIHICIVFSVHLAQRIVWR